MAQKKGPRVSEDAEELPHVPLQAILLADSFAQAFRPITLERPKVLLPLVNVPMIDYTLAWLESAGVEEVFVFCCAHSKLVMDYLEKSDWLHQPTFSVTAIESHNSTSAGDALRLIYERNVIQGDFILISGDTLSNMSLTQVLKEHKERRKKDMQAIMTMIIKQSKPSPVTHQTRLGNDELIMAIDPETNQLHYYEDKTDHSKGVISLDKSLLAENPAVYLRNDMQDCYIDICSPEVLSLFTDNFDYQHLRRHFVKGLLVDDIMGYKIFTHEINSSYAARIDNFRSYDTISKDILQRWTYPLVPDVLFSRNCSLIKLERQGTYKASDVTQSRSAQIGSFSLVGQGTTVGDNSTITNSVVGRGCTIGSNVLIESSYIWNNVVIQDDCKLSHVIVCDDVVIKAGACLEPGTILSFKVVIGPQFIVPAYSKVSLLPQPTKQDSDEELEYADSSSGAVEIQSSTDVLDIANEESNSPYSQCHGTSEVGVSGAGYIWSVCEGGHEEEWRHSIAPIPLDKLTEINLTLDDDTDLTNQDGNHLPPSGELLPDSESAASASASDGDFSEVSKGDYYYFEKEVEATILRAVNEAVDLSNVTLEINSLRLSYNMQFADCASAIFYSMIKLASEEPHSNNGELLGNARRSIARWKDLLKLYLHSVDEEFEVLQKFEEMCLESTKEFSPIFALVLHELYDKEITSEDAILQWEAEKEGADEADKIFLRQSQKFLQWLKEAPEESTDEES